MEIRKLITTLGYNVDGSGIDEYEQSIKKIKKTILEMKVVLKENTKIIKEHVSNTKAVEAATKAASIAADKKAKRAEVASNKAISSKKKEASLVKKKAMDEMRGIKKSQAAKATAAAKIARIDNREIARARKLEATKQRNHIKEVARIKKEATLVAQKDDKSARRAAAQSRADKRGKINSMRQVGMSMRSVGVGMMATLTAPIAAAMVKGIKSSAFMESETVGMGVMLGDPARAQQLIGEMEQLAAKTPLKLQALTQTSNLLLASGVKADELLDKVRQLGDVARGDAGKMDRISIQYAQIRLRGKAMWEDIRRIGEAGVPIIDELTRVLGVSKEELMELSRKGRISSESVEQAFTNMTSEGGQFNGMMEQMSKTLGGKWTTTTDNFTIMLRTLMETIQPLAKILMDFAISFFQWITAMPKFVHVAIVGLALFTAAAGVAVTAAGALLILLSSLANAQMNLGKATAWATANLNREGIALLWNAAKTGVLILAKKALVGVQTLLLALTGPKGWAMLAGGLALAGAATYGVSKMLNKGRANSGNSQYATTNKGGGNSTHQVNVNAKLEMPEGTPESQTKYVTQIANEAFERSMMSTLQNSNSNVGRGTQ